jgi:Tfp pilus assembly protein PilE
MTIVLWIVKNWRFVAIAAAIAIPSLYAALLKHQRDGARDTIAKMVIEARIQEEKTKAEIDRQKTVTEELDRAHKKNAARIVTDNARLRSELHESASRSIVPAVPEASGSADDDPVACFDRGRINVELTGVLQRYAERLGAIALKGENTAEAFAVCQAWALKEASKRPASPAQ